MARTSATSRTSSGWKSGVTVVGAVTTSPASTGRPSAVQALSPPSSTKTLVKPMTRRVHQTRAAARTPKVS